MIEVDGGGLKLIEASSTRRGCCAAGPSTTSSASPWRAPSSRSPPSCKPQSTTVNHGQPHLYLESTCSSIPAMREPRPHSSHENRPELLYYTVQYYTVQPWVSPPHSHSRWLQRKSDQRICICSMLPCFQRCLSELLPITKYKYHKHHKHHKSRLASLSALALRCDFPLSTGTTYSTWDRTSHTPRTRERQSR